MVTTSEDRLLRIPEAARLLGMGRTTVYQMIREGRLPVVRLGKRGVRIPISALTNWITEHTEPATSD